MELSSRIVHLRIRVKDDIAISPLHPVDVTLLCADAHTYDYYHNIPKEYFVSFQSDECITDVLTVPGTTEWMGTIWTSNMENPEQRWSSF